MKSSTLVTAEPDSQQYHVPHTLLAGVSARLASHCAGSGRLILNVSNGAFRIFLAWLLHRDIHDIANSQLELAEAWNFGAAYDIPAFQDTVMNDVLLCMVNEHVEPEAVLEAYRVTKRGTLLQRALIGQLAIDMRGGDSYAWDRDTFKEHKLDKVPEFYLDLTEAVCPCGEDAEQSLPSLSWKIFCSLMQANDHCFFWTLTCTGFVLGQVDTKQLRVAITGTSNSDVKEIK